MRSWRQKGRSEDKNTDSKSLDHSINNIDDKRHFAIVCRSQNQKFAAGKFASKLLILDFGII